MTSVPQSRPTAIRIYMICMNTEHTILAERFSVDIPFFDSYGLPTIVYDFIKKVASIMRELFEGISISSVVVWKIKSTRSLRSFGPITRFQRTQAIGNKNKQDIEQYIRDFDFKSQAEELRSPDGHGMFIKDLFDQDSTLVNHLHVIVEVPERKKRLREVADDQANNRPPTKITALYRRDEVLREAEKDTHSAYPNNIDAVNTIYSAIYGGRPTHRYGFPPGLYHPALATLRYDLEASGYKGAVAITSDNREIFNLALEFYKAATGSAKNEGGRWDKMQALFSHIFGDEDQRELSLSDHPATLKPDIVWGNPAYVILELKTDAGVGGDASLQAVRAYIHECSLLEGKRTVFPAILVGVMGNVLEISTVVTPQDVHYTKILHLELQGSDDLKVDIRKLVQIALALKKCARTLKKEHDSQIHLLDQTPVLEKWYLPRPTLHPSYNHPRPELTFVCPLSRSNDKVDEAGPTPEHSLFLGVMDTKEVVVKFTADYNEYAHELLAKQQLAPKLLGSYPLMGCGELRMVVMERIDGTPMALYDKRSLSPSVFADLEMAMELLHAEDFVFGDLRAVNVMVVEKDKDSASDVKHGMLVDFDWVGRHNEDSYLPIINYKLIGKEWHRDFCAQGLMQKDHDEWALQKIIKDYRKVTQE